MTLHAPPLGEEPTRSNCARAAAAANCNSKSVLISKGTNAVAVFKRN